MHHSDRPLSSMRVFSRLRAVALSALALAVSAFAGEVPPEYLERRAAAESDYAAAVARAADQAFEQAQQMQVKARKSGNVTAQAVARTAVKIATDAKAAIAKGEKPVFPENIRRELTEWADDFKRRLSTAEGARDAAFDAIKEEFGDLSEAVAAQEAEAVADPADDAADGDDEPVPDVPPTISEEAANWIPVAHVTITCGSLEMIGFPVIGVTERKHTDGESPMTGEQYAIDWEPVNELVVGDGAPVFRATPENGREVDVTDWPSRANGYNIEVRVRPDPRGRPLSFLLEAGEGTAEFKPVAKPDDGAGAAGAVAAEGGDAGDGEPAGEVGGGLFAIAGEKVRVRFESDPEGASVIIDGRPLSSGGRMLATPFEAEIPVGAVKEITFRKRGFLDASYKDVTPAAGATLRGRLKPDARFIDKRVQVHSGSPSWQNTDVKVRKGQKISLSTLGKWQCGGDKTADAIGYPNDDQCFEYYLDPKKYPRVMVSENFGCMIVRVAPDGAPRAIHSLQTTFTADADGTLSFDVNEAKSARRDNHGSITVRIQVAP